ncbi:TPA: hypothetical protein ACQZOI_005580, partial [Raoultella ornithinolytica]
MRAQPYRSGNKTGPGPRWNRFKKAESYLKMKLVLVEFYPLNECRTEIIPPEKYYFSRLFCGLVGEKEAAARYKTGSPRLTRGEKTISSG